MAKASDQFAGKYAAEAYDLVVLAKLFQGSLYGLLLFELGWIGFLYFLLKLPLGNPRSLMVPGIRIRPLGFTEWHVDIGSVWLAGAIFLLAYWLLKVRGFVLRRMLVRAAVLFIWRPIVLLFASILALADLLILLIIMLVWDSWRMEKRKLQERDRRLEKIRIQNQKAGRETTEEEAAQRLDAELKKNYPNSKDPLADATTEAIVSRYNSHFLEAGFNLVRLTFAESHARIGIAPLGEFPGTDSPSAPWNSARVFGTAAEKLNAEARRTSWPPARFHFLPSHLVVRNPKEARWLRRFMGLDAVIWGHHRQTGDETVWVRFEIAGRRQPSGDPQSRRDEDHQYRSSLLKSKVDAGIGSLDFPADDDWGSLVTLCGCLLRVLKYRDERWDRGWRKKASDLRLGFAIFHMGDKLAKHKHRYASEVYRFLATMIVPCRKPDDSQCAVVATPDSLLAETVSSWVGHWFTEYPSVWDDEEDLESRPFLIELRRLLEYCSATEPHRAEHLYRLGLILCLLGEVGASAETLRRAGEVDVRNLRTDAIMALVLGQQALGDVNFKHGKALRLSKARWAMYLAAVIAIEGEKGKTRVREELPKARGLFDRDQPPDPAEIVLERLLEIQ